MFFIILFLMFFSLNSDLYSAINMFNENNNMQNNVLRDQIVVNETILLDQESSNEERIKAQLQLIKLYYFGENDYARVRTLCLQIISNPDTFHYHAPYFLGEIYFHGYGVNINYDIARNYYQTVINNRNQDDQMELGPCDYRLLSQLRLIQLSNMLNEIPNSD